MMDGGQRGNLMGSNNTQNKILVMVCINLANLVCHSVYSVLAAFFPQEGKAKGMSDDTVGVIFAAFAAVSIVCSPFVGRLMSMHGKVWIYILGLLLVSVSTISFSVASLLPAGAPFAAWCLAMRILQGLGAALEETAAYAAQFFRPKFRHGIAHATPRVRPRISPTVAQLRDHRRHRLRERLILPRDH